MALSNLRSRIARFAASLDDEQEERPSWASACIVGVLALVLIPFLWTPWIHGNDPVRYYAYCRSLWIDGDLDFTDEFAHYRSVGELQIPPSADPVTGRPGNALGIGMAVLWSPFFLLGHLAAKAGGWPSDGYSTPYAWAICLGSTLYAAAGLVLLTRVLSWRFDSRSATIGVVGVWLGSPLVFYMYLHPSMSHAGSFFLCSLLVWEYERWRRRARPRHLFLVGLTFGLAAATRYDSAAYLWLAAALGIRSRLARLFGFGPSRRKQNWGETLGSLGLIGLGILVGFAPQLAAWRFMYGDWFAGPRDYRLGETLAVWRSPNLMAVLLSGHRGLFIWSPVLLLAVVGLVRMIGKDRLSDYALVAAFLTQLWVVGGWSMWWGGASFGQRFFISLTPAFALGLTCLARDIRFRPARRMFMAALALCLLWSAGLAVQYVGGIVDRERPVGIGELTRNQLTKAPAWLARHGRLLLPGGRGAVPESPGGRAESP